MRLVPVLTTLCTLATLTVAAPAGGAAKRATLPPSEETAASALEGTPRHAEWVDVPLASGGTPIRTFVVFPGSGGVKRLIEQPDPRLGGQSIADVFRAVGGEIRDSWCGPCFGQGPDALAAGETAITSFNRNWQNRMGVGGLGYLASPAVVAASALLGYMAPPGELGLDWDPSRFGV